ncbi:11843_t:CDS:2, partial [Gigaspora rosea]
GKFQNLVRDHTLMCQYMAENRAGRKTRTGRPDKVLEHSSAFAFDQIHNVNASSRRRKERWRNRTPPPTYEEVSSMINMSRRESPASQRDRSASLTRKNPTRRDETTNRDNVSNVNDVDGNSGHNTNDV